MTRLGILLSAVLLSGCSRDTAPPAESYLVVMSIDDASGWAAVDRLKGELPAADRQRIGVPTMLSEKSSAMLVPFVGNCERNRALFDRMARIAAGEGVSGTRCEATIPN